MCLALVHAGFKPSNTQERIVLAWQRIMGSPAKCSPGLAENDKVRERADEILLMSPGRCVAEGKLKKKNSFSD